MRLWSFYDKQFLVFNEDTISTERFAEIFNCSCDDVTYEYEDLFYSGEYYDFQRLKLQAWRREELQYDEN